MSIALRTNTPLILHYMRKPKTESLVGTSDHSQFLSVTAGSLTNPHHRKKDIGSDRDRE